LTLYEHAGSDDHISNVSVGYGIEDRPWFEKWWLTTQELAALERAYGRELILPDTSHYKALATRFCSECWGHEGLAAGRQGQGPPFRSRSG